MNSNDLKLYGYSSDSTDAKLLVALNKNLTHIVGWVNKRNIAKTTRVRVYKRDKYTCLKCGCKDKSLLTCDHIIPRSKGGRNVRDNLQTLCEKCNNEKGDKIISYLRKNGRNIFHI